MRRGLLVVLLAAAACRNAAPIQPAAPPGTAKRTTPPPLSSTHRDSAEFRARAAEPLSRPAPPGARPVVVRLLAFNDFHGQLTPVVLDGRPAGGAAVLAAYLDAARRGYEGRSLILHAGDQVGATPPSSALLQDEPSIEVLNLLANEHCVVGGTDPRCDVVGALGNHEFDEGQNEMLRLLRGGNHSQGPFLQDPYRGARYPTLCANVTDAAGRTLVPAHTVVELGGVRVGVVGAVVRDTPKIVRPEGIAGLTFGDEAEAINRSVAALREDGVRAIVAAIHQGGAQERREGDWVFEGPVIRDIVAKLDGEVDLVVSGHSHAFANTTLPTSGGKPVLVTQAFFRSTAFAQIDLGLDPTTGDVVSSDSRVVTTYGDAGPGLTPHLAVAATVARAQHLVAPRVARVAGRSVDALPNPLEEETDKRLGNLVADAIRASVRADVALVNGGGIRAGLPQGPVTWGDLMTVQPFDNRVVRIRLTGRQVRGVLEQQWTRSRSHRLLHVSGLRYTWDPARPAGDRVLSVEVGGRPLDPDASYTVAVYDFLAAGGDEFSTLTAGTDLTSGPSDVEAMADYLASLPQPFRVPPEERAAVATPGAPTGPR